MSDSSSQLPAEVRSAWSSARSRRAPRPELNLDRIIEAGLHVADTNGLGAISMARVAKELGFATMSLYRHVSSKDELLVHLQDAALGEPPRELVTDQGWREGLTIFTQQLLSAYSARAWALSIPIKAPPMMPKSMAWLDWALRIMTDLSLEPMEKMSTVLLLTGYARHEATMMATLDRSGPADVEEDTAYESALRELLDPQEMPALHDLVSNGRLFEINQEIPNDDGDMFMLDFGLHRILDGIEALTARRAG